MRNPAVWNTPQPRIQATSKIMNSTVKMLILLLFEMPRRLDTDHAPRGWHSASDERQSTKNPRRQCAALSVAGDLALACERRPRRILPSSWDFERTSKVMISVAQPCHTEV